MGAVIFVGVIIMFHTEELKASRIFLVRLFESDKLIPGVDEYKTIFLLLENSDFIELIGLNGRVSRKDYKTGISFLRAFSKEKLLPIRAKRVGEHRLPSRDFNKINNNWWELK